MCSKSNENQASNFNVEEEKSNMINSIYNSKSPPPEYVSNPEFTQNKREKLEEINRTEKKNENEVIKKIQKAKQLFYKLPSTEIDAKTAYNLRAFTFINKIRENPKWFSKIILQEIKSINKETTTQINPETCIEEEKITIYYQKKVKVLLYQGETAFKQAANYFNQIPSMDSLIFKKEICLPLPNNINEMNSISFINSKVNDIRKNNNINMFFKDHIKNPEDAILLMMIDDVKESKNKYGKRDALLNRDFKYIGIDNKFIDKQFVAFYSLGK